MMRAFLLCLMTKSPNRSMPSSGILALGDMVKTSTLSPPAVSAALAMFLVSSPSPWFQCCIGVEPPIICTASVSWPALPRSAASAASGPGVGVTDWDRASGVGPTNTLNECVAITIFWPLVIGLVWLRLSLPPSSARSPAL